MKMRILLLALSALVLGGLLYAVERSTASEADYHNAYEREQAEEDEPTLDEPWGLRGTAHQREIELTWRASSEPDISYEVLVGETLHQGIEGNSFVVEGLEPDTHYTVALRAVRDEEYSPYVEESFTTRAMERAVDAPDRVPYLRTITEDGRARRSIATYFNDLARHDATISYAINGEAVEPEGGLLTFPSRGRHTLVVRIDEGEGYRWRLTYHLSIMN